MDNKEQNNLEDSSSFFQKNKTPIIISSIGVVLIIPLYWFLVASPSYKAIDLVSQGSTENAQEVYQANPELSANLQIECQNSVDKINSTNDCQQQEVEFFKFADSCLNYSYSVEKPKALLSDGNYGDIIFSILKCYQKNNEDISVQKEMIEKGLKLPDWEYNVGPISCQSKISLQAYLSALSVDSSGACLKPNSINQIKEQIQQKNLNVLSSLIHKNRPAQVGLKDSDVACVFPLNEIKVQLEKLLNQKVELNIVGDSQQDQTQSQFIEINKSGSQIALLKLSSDDRNCLYLDSLLTSEQLDEQ